MDNIIKPLAEKLRPSKLNEYVGQSHIAGNDKIISKLVTNEQKTGYFPSLIFWGPPGCGKTTLARIISNELNRSFYEFSAVNASIKEIEKIIFSKPKNIGIFEYSDSKQNDKFFKAPIIFIDEIHRFNKAQQDALLPHVEKGTIIFIGATTENPSFEVIGPLLSRCRVVVLKQHQDTDLEILIQKALDFLGTTLSKDAQNFLIQCSNGDARVALNVLEIANSLASSHSDNQPSTSQNKVSLEIDNIKEALQKEQLTFDLRGDEYYNTISALHKTIRGSDPDAALYYLARMLEAGQDPLYIARRLIRTASEDIGLADTNALTVALNAFMVCERLGMPECNVALAETVVYLAKAPKSNLIYMAYSRAAEDVKTHGNLPIPLHILNAPTKLMKGLGYGKGYDYSHSASGTKKQEIEYFPDKIHGTKYL